jgi:hypothetical protein
MIGIDSRTYSTVNLPRGLPDALGSLSAVGSTPGESTFHELVAAGPRLFFRKWDPATGAELWALEAN